MKELPNIEQRFDANLAEFGSRVTKIKASSADALPDLLVAGHRYDIIYVDGDHRASAALRDLLLAWPLLNRGGIMIIDDYEFDALADAIDRPKLGVDQFTSQLDPAQYSLLHKGYQLILSRR
jgi:predicted O-methyltransferase YrrM